MADYLTKSSVMSGLQCPKRLWLGKHDPIPREEIEPNAILDTGTNVGRCAHYLFPGGQLIDAKPWEHDAAVAHTRQLMNDPGIPAIFEAAFEAHGVRIRVDILERLPQGKWRLNEVKASTGLKEEHLPDIAVQYWVMKQAGCDVVSASLLHVNKSYVRGAGEIDWSGFFTRANVSSEIMPFVERTPSILDEHFAVLKLGAAPGIEPSEHCHSPYSCEFWERCTAGKPTAGKPKDWIFHLPRLSAEKSAELRSAGIEAIRDIPETFPLTYRQKIIRDTIATGREWVSDELAGVLATIEPPCFYLDFETMNPAIPLYAGTSPYQRQPFQWSLHHIDERGALAHWEFLADGSGDPRRRFTESLIEMLAGSTVPIVVYSGFENGVLRDMAKLYPDLADAIAGIQERLHDLLGTVRGNYCHSDFIGSYSIKDVGPVLAPDITYDDLPLIADGGAASHAFGLLAGGSVSGEKTDGLRQALLTYCERDTLAMVRVHRALRERVCR